MRAEQFFDALFDDYTAIAPQVARLRSLIEGEYGQVTNDHVAFRTFDRPGMSLVELERAFLNWGYTRHQPYHFVDKHLEAFGYVPSNSQLPLIFLSEFAVSSLPAHLQNWIDAAVAPLAERRMRPEDLLRAGRLWEIPTWKIYQELEAASPYAAWLSVWGLCANHFTIALHHLPSQPSLAELVSFLEQHGIEMNVEGGKFKGTQADLLEQASTMAELRPVTFADGSQHHIPSCYYEFARRHPDEHGALYLGFVAASATNIFESTTMRKEELPPKTQAQ